MVADEELVLAVELVELDLPHAASVSASSAQLASTPILFLFTTSPLNGFLTARRHVGPCAGSVQAAVLSIGEVPVVNIS